MLNAIVHLSLITSFESLFLLRCCSLQYLNKTCLTLRVKTRKIKMQKPKGQGAKSSQPKKNGELGDYCISTKHALHVYEVMNYEMHPPTRKSAKGVNIYLVAYQVDGARYCASGGAGLTSGRGNRATVEPHRRRMLGHRR